MASACDIGEDVMVELHGLCGVSHLNVKGSTVARAGFVLSTTIVNDIVGDDGFSRGIVCACELQAVAPALTDVAMRDL